MTGAPGDVVCDPVADGVGVAISGGRDSTALLHAIWQQAKVAGLRVVALHVHHGLQPEADMWVKHLAELVAAWANGDSRLSFAWRRLSDAPLPGESVEAWARRRRYAALTEMARVARVSVVCLAHHQKDQAETFLLQALRGGGVHALSAMERESRRGGVVWARPWLGVTSSAVEAYVSRYEIPYVNDPSNSDSRFDRNRLRNEIFPGLKRGFPGAEKAFAAAALNLQSAAALADEIALVDLRSMGASPLCLPLMRWGELSPHRQLFALRAWMLGAARKLGVPPPRESTWTDLSAKLGACHSGQWQGRGAVVWRLYRGELQAVIAPPNEKPRPSFPQANSEPLCRVTQVLDIHASLDLPMWGGKLSFARVQSGGLTGDVLRDAKLVPREGGEQFQLGVGRPPRSLKKQFQACGCAVWLRNVPLLVSGAGELLYVPGLGVDARHLAPEGCEQWWPVWEPLTPVPV